MQSFQNRVATHTGATPLISNRTVSLKSHGSVDGPLVAYSHCTRCGIGTGTAN